MKKSILVLAALAATLVLAGCGACKAPQDTTVYSTTAATTTTTAKHKPHHVSKLAAGKETREDKAEPNTSN